jgi:hypothetical protein
MFAYSTGGLMYHPHLHVRCQRGTGTVQLGHAEPRASGACVLGGTGQRQQGDRFAPDVKSAKFSRYTSY